MLPDVSVRHTVRPRAQARGSGRHLGVDALDSHEALLQHLAAGGFVRVSLELGPDLAERHQRLRRQRLGRQERDDLQVRLGPERSELLPEPVDRRRVFVSTGNCC